MNKYQCIECGKILDYDNKTECYFCNNCGCMYSAYDVINDKRYHIVLDNISNTENAFGDMYEGDNEPKKQSEDIFNKKTSMNIYKCYSCGIIFYKDNDRIAEQYNITNRCNFCGEKSLELIDNQNVEKPKKILPFAINEEKALDNVEKAIKNGKYMPKCVKQNLEINIGAIYLPMWLFSSYMGISAVVSGRKDRYGYEVYSRNHVDEEKAFFQETNDIINLSASKYIPNEIAIELNQYPISNCVELDEVDLDNAMILCPDIEADSLSNISKNCQYTKLIQQTLIENSYSSAENEENIDRLKKLVKVIKLDYTVNSAQMYYLPVYIASYMCNGEKYFMYVNGYNGDIVGTLPVQPIKVLAAKIIYSILLSLVISFIVMELINFSIEVGGGLVMLVCLLSFWGLTSLNNEVKNYLKQR